MKRFVLTFEFAALFIALPLAFAAKWIPLGRVMFLVLAAVMLGCAVFLSRDKTFNFDQLWNPAGLRRDLKRIAGVFLLALAPLTLGVWWFDPHEFLGFPCSRPGLWLLVMTLYPLVSVYPQEVVYRPFLFHRYRVLFPRRWLMIAASALAFSFMHIIFRNWIAVGLTLPGGVLFAYTYSRSRSTLACWLEHSLYGCALITLGLGWYFYHGGVH